MPAPQQIPQNSFTSGEVSPLIASRSDIQSYNSSLKKALNAIIHPQGAVSMRRGTVDVSNIIGAIGRHVLQAFVPDSENAYILNFSTLGLEIRQVMGGNALIVLNPLNSDYPYAFDSTPPFQSEQLQQLRFLQSADVMYIFHPNVAPYKLIRKAVDVFELQKVQFKNGPFRVDNDIDTLKLAVAGGLNPSITASGTGSANFFTDSKIGSFVKVYAFVKAFSYSVRLTQSTVSQISFFVAKGRSWSFKTSGTWNGILRFIKNETNEVIYEFQSDTTMNYNVSFVANEDCNIHYEFIKEGTTDIVIYIVMDRYSFRYEDVLVINSINSSTVALCSRKNQNNAFTQAVVATSGWALGAFSEENGYPFCGVFYQDRLVLSGTIVDPQSIYFSRTGLYEDFGFFNPIEESDAININLPSRRVSKIVSMVALGEILVFTNEVVFSVGSAGSAVSPFNVMAKQQSYRGASDVQPCIIGNRVIFVGVDGILRDIAYSFSEDGYDGEDLTIRATHLFEGKKVLDIEYQQFPESLVYCLLDDGTMAVLTYLREQQVLAWSSFEMYGKVENITLVNNGSFSRLYMICRRPLGTYGSVRLEYLLSSSFASKKINIAEGEDTIVWEEMENNVFVDGARVILNDTREPFGENDIGKDYYIAVGDTFPLGVELVAVVDGTVVRGKTVDIPAPLVRGIKVPRSWARAVVGYPFHFEIETLSLNVQQMNLSPLKGRTPFAVIDFYKSAGGRVGVSNGESYPLFQRTDEDMGLPLKLQSGKTNPITLETTNQQTKSIFITQDDPLPITILSVSIAVTAGEK